MAGVISDNHLLLLVVVMFLAGATAGWIAGSLNGYNTGYRDGRRAR